MAKLEMLYGFAAQHEMKRRLHEMHSRALLILHKLAEGVMIERIGNNSGDDIRNQLCPHDAVEAEEVIHQEEKRNVYHALTKRGQNQGFLAHTHSLEGEGDLQIEEHKGYGKAEYAKEVGRHLHSLRVTVECACDL